MGGLDYRHLFATALTDLMCEVFPAHGIDSMPDEDFEDMVAELTAKEYFATIYEFRRSCGMTLLGRF